MKRTVIKIDEQLCYGCGDCVTGCHEGALQLIDGKAVMISDLYCDGLGACIGECPVGAISFEQREALPYDEVAVMKRLVPKGEAVVLAHLKHLKEHNEHEWVRQGIGYLREHGIAVDLSKIGLTMITDDEQKKEQMQQFSATMKIMPDAPKPVHDGLALKPLGCGCPGSMAREIKRPAGAAMPLSSGEPGPTGQSSELRQFPVQLHLVDPQAGFFQSADLLLAADCTAFACGDFHSRLLRGKTLAIACPKLDSNTQIYVDKLVQMIDRSKINTLTVAVMEVPCCQGLVRIAQTAREQAQRNIPLKIVVLSVTGEIIDDKWI
ncbi:ATP-binding protein [uncultured Alistipes sp.]|jgi:iron-sulfur cluster-binding protein|uniref:ATP-binding protein n=1 Tax=uncultured Alistipes sp. TaxID=538949 RepID=UPI0025E307BA|nr:4Fe-4S dicluster domain-containing protein [uncultured Alistipes sp.]